MRFTGSDRDGPFVTGLRLVVFFFVAVGTSLASSGESGGGGGVTVVPDGSVIIQIINFIVLIFILNFLLYRPIRKILTQRKEKIQGLELSIETNNTVADEKDLAFVQGIKEARVKGLQEKDALLQEADEEEKRLLGQINDKAQSELAEVRIKIAGDVDSAKEALSTKVDEFANAISRKILGRTV